MGQKRLTFTNHSQSWGKALKVAGSKSVLVNDDRIHPSLIIMSGNGAEKKLEDLVNQNPITQVIDNYDEQLAELFVSKNAQLFKANYEVKVNSIKEMLQDHYGRKQHWKLGSWVYYPWSGQLVHVLQEDLYWELRTIRNKILITEPEQAKFKNFNIACAGMSVGSNGAAGIVLTSGSKHLKLADGAVLSGSNLNRVRTGIKNIGLNKCILIARELYEMNPYLKIHAVTENLTALNIEDFMTEPWKADLIVDEIDDLEVKVRLRLEAKKRRIPLIMVTEPGNQIMVDVERYDLDAKLPIFHGKAPGIEAVLTKGSLNDREKIKYIATIIGASNLPIRDQKAMLKVGTEIPSPPQLGSTAMMAGGVIAYVARQIAVGAPIKSGRHLFSLDKKLMSESKKIRNKLKHSRHSRALKRIVASM